MFSLFYHYFGLWCSDAILDEATAHSEQGCGFLDKREGGVMSQWNVETTKKLATVSAFLKMSLYLFPDPLCPHL